MDKGCVNYKVNVAQNNAIQSTDIILASTLKSIWQTSVHTIRIVSYFLCLPIAGWKFKGGTVLQRGDKSNISKMSF